MLEIEYKQATKNTKKNCIFDKRILRSFGFDYLTKVKRKELAVVDGDSDAADYVILPPSGSKRPNLVWFLFK